MVLKIVIIGELAGPAIRKMTGDEEMVRLRQELLDTRKERFDMMCQADKFGKENVNLKEELRDSELARSNTQVYYEKKIQNMKTEIEKMRSSSTSSQEYVFFFFQIVHILNF